MSSHLDAPHLFRFDRAEATAQLRDSVGGRIWPVNAFTDADELRALLEAAQSARLISASLPTAEISIRPLSISRPAPLLLLALPGDTALLGPELLLEDREEEDPIAFTLRLLAEAVEVANRAASRFLADSVHLERLAAYLNRPGQWRGADVCDFLATELQRSGRPILDDPS